MMQLRLSNLFGALLAVTLFGLLGTAARAADLTGKFVYDGAPPAAVVVDNKGGQFHPHMTALWVGKQNLFFTNSDPVSHNSNFNLAGVNPLLPPSAKLPIAVAGTKLLPQEVTCTIHPWMKAYVVP